MSLWFLLGNFFSLSCFLDWNSLEKQVTGSTSSSTYTLYITMWFYRFMLSTCTLIEYILFNLLHFLYFSTPRSVVLRKTHIGVLYIFYLLSLLIVIKKQRCERKLQYYTRAIHGLEPVVDSSPMLNTCILFVCLFFGGRGLGAFVGYFLIYLLVYLFIYLFISIYLFVYLHFTVGKILNSDLNELDTFQSFDESVHPFTAVQKQYQGSNWIRPKNDVVWITFSK